MEGRRGGDDCGGGILRAGSRGQRCACQVEHLKALRHRAARQRLAAIFSTSGGFGNFVSGTHAVAATLGLRRPAMGRRNHSVLTLGRLAIGGSLRRRILPAVEPALTTVCNSIRSAAPLVRGIGRCNTAPMARTLLDLAVCELTRLSRTQFRLGVVSGAGRAARTRYL